MRALRAAGMLAGVRLQIAGVSPLHALEQLARAGIRVRNVQKLSATRLNFCVKCKETEKIFAIFARSCYTVTRIENIGLTRAAAFLRRRPAFIAGALLALSLAAAGDAFVLRVRVGGSASRFSARAEAILAEEGLHPFALYSEAAAERAEAALLGLPGVAFASVGKAGCVLTVTLEEETSLPPPAAAADLVAPRAGVVETLTVLRGTPLAAEGEAVAAGQALAGAFFLTESGERRQTPAVARASLLCSYTEEFVGAADGESFRIQSIAAARLRAGGELVASHCTVREEGGAYVCTVTLTVRVRASVNLGE